MTVQNHRAVFDAVRAIKGGALTQPEVDRLNAVLTVLAPTVVAVGPAEHDEITRLAIDHLDDEEGRVPHAYQDHLGYWTIGTGRLIDKRRGGRLTDAEIDMLLANDIARFRLQLATDPDTAAAWARVKDDPVRAVALLSMAFQMGTGGAGADDLGLSGFDGTLAHVAAGRFAAAADGMLSSKWAGQTPKRAKRVAAMLRTGKAA